MRLLFFDLEYATQRKDMCAVCEFGYTITDEYFNVIERDNLIINPDISHNSWDWYVLRNILTRPIKEYTKQPKLTYYYQRIAKLFENSDYVIGHSLDSDTVSFNRNLQRYGLNSKITIFMMSKSYINLSQNRKMVHLLRIFSANWK